MTILEFESNWCRPCAMIAPLVQSLSEQFNVPVSHIDTESDELTTESFAVQSLPTLVFLENNEEVGRIVGFYPRPKLEALFGAIINGV